MGDTNIIKRKLIKQRERLIQNGKKLIFVQNKVVNHSA
jgi:hypothetical protein